MKREIKFRGYDPDTKRWYFGSLVKQNKTTYVTSEDYDQNPSNTEWFIFWDEMTDWCLPNRHLQGSVDPKSIGEYTGLHDKNGREIYEGDIVHAYDQEPDQYEPDYRGSEATGIVEFHGSMFMLDDDIVLDYPPILEVIGNIYENPEMMEGSDD